jgi:hypothetical protein
VYGTTPVASTVACLNAAARDAMERVIPRGILNSTSKFPHWYSASLTYYIRKTNILQMHEKRNSIVFIKIVLSIEAC